MFCPTTTYHRAFIAPCTPSRGQAITLPTLDSTEEATGGVLARPILTSTRPMPRRTVQSVLLVVAILRASRVEIAGVGALATVRGGC